MVFSCRRTVRVTARGYSALACFFGNIIIFLSAIGVVLYCSTVVEKTGGRLRKHKSSQSRLDECVNSRRGYEKKNKQNQWHRDLNDSRWADIFVRPTPGANKNKTNVLRTRPQTNFHAVTSLLECARYNNAIVYRFRLWHLLLTVPMAEKLKT